MGIKVTGSTKSLVAVSKKYKTGAAGKGAVVGSWHAGSWHLEFVERNKKVVRSRRHG